MKSKILLTTILLFLFISPVQATPCDSEDIARLKNLAEHVDISYSEMPAYTITENEMPKTYKDRYTIKISNMTDELYVIMIDESNNKTNINPDNNQTILQKYINPGEKRVNIYSKQCQTNLKQATIQLLYYNEYSKTSECTRINESIDICKPWTKEEITEKRFKTGLNNYYDEEITVSRSTEILDIVSTNLTFILLTIAVIIIAAIAIIVVYKKRNELK